MSEHQKDYPAISRLAGDREVDDEHNEIAGPENTSLEGSSTTQPTDGPPLDLEPAISSDLEVETTKPPKSAGESGLSAHNRLDKDAGQNDPKSDPTAARITERNRKNAEKSTGPTSKSGKNRTRLNACKCGMYATTILLPGESKTAYRNLSKRMREKYSPQDDVDESLLEQAVDAKWRLRRQKIAERLHLEQFQRRQACEVEQPIRIVNGKRVDLGLEEVLDRFAEDAAPSDEDIGRALRKLIDTENLERSARISRERRKLMEEFLKAIDELEKRQQRRQRTSDNSETA